MNIIKKILLAFSFVLLLSALPSVAKADSLSLVSRTKLTNYPWGVSKKNNIVYVPNRSKISIVDVSNKYAPIFIKNHDNFDNVLSVFVNDTILYCRGASLFTTANISDSVNPVNLYWKLLVGSSDYPRGIFALNNLCYIAAGGGITIFNVTNPAAPDSVGFYDTPGAVCDLVIRDTLAYTACTESLYIVNVKNPSNCYRVGAAPMPTNAIGVTLQGNYAYVACCDYFNYDGRVVSVDISNPANPVVLDILNIQGNPLTVSYSKGCIYNIAGDGFEEKKQTAGLQIGSKETATIEGGLRVINVAKPDSIYYVTGYNTFADPRDAIVDDSGYVYIADQDSGLVILKHFVTGVAGEPIAEATPTYPQINLYPNPIKNKATIEYTVAKAGPVSIKVYNTLGQTLRTLVNNNLQPGHYSVVWNGLDEEKRKAAAGVYFYRYCSGGYSSTGKIVVIR